MADEVTSTGLTWLCDRAAAQEQGNKELTLVRKSAGRI